MFVGSVDSDYTVGASALIGGIAVIGGLGAYFYRKRGTREEYEALVTQVWSWMMSSYHYYYHSMYNTVQ